MRLLMPMVFCILLMAGCTSNRSISYYGRGYNPSYTGEISQLAFLRSVSRSNGDKADAGIKVTQGSRIMVIQSGQAFPDAGFINAIQDRGTIVPVSGNPEIGGTESGTILDAARAGGVDFIIAYWGNIRNTSDNMVSIEVSAIVVDVDQGCWTNAMAHSDTIDEEHSFFNQQRADDIQVVELKNQVYGRLANALFPQ